ncbi:hypothetical protein BABINDRAFT_159703 [Babjeviella inositovora NRRL Y-12698]|uniref:Secreted protein n=1 Tax=Babjeviella inositovora NRRL Y-12698 TaxID=984486 RepID=A0A1E3R050_9ASCO|nr:uncharacterized protein BABINDRAFT_159703 [Babjeviella inositovora NRRL Y-12698]ODQ83271.1 hypothetical protein BABINDRAFT_159703 [Babjeviella inositovora NRRL Y-12698]
MTGSLLGLVIPLKVLLIYVLAFPPSLLCLSPRNVCSLEAIVSVKFLRHNICIHVSLAPGFCIGLYDQQNTPELGYMISKIHQNWVTAIFQ